MTRLARRVSACVLAAAVLIGAVGIVYYARRDLTLSHYDARAHVMVARRITDNLTPGWRQIGAVWLPLPHALNALVVRPDWSYRTGYPSAVLSMLVLATGLAVLSGYLFRRSGSVSAAVVGPAVMLLNPNLLYLQSTPMTEPLLIGLACVSLAAVDAWMRDPSPARRRQAGMAIVALMLTRYEGWCVAGALVSLSALEMRRLGARSLALVPYVLATVVAFLGLGWAATGQWFVTSGFFVVDNPSFGRPIAALIEVGSATVDLGGIALVTAGAAGALACLARARRSTGALLPLALAAAAALPWFAFFQGHPHRVRYMVPAVAAAAVLAAFAVAAVPGRLRAWGAAVLVALAVYQRPPFDQSADMVLEAQWETPFRREREIVTRFLVGHHDGTPILASMGSLGHYMQETSTAHVDLVTFLHEGNGDLWAKAVAAPGRFVRWILIEERAEGGDMLAARARESPAFLAGFTRVAEGGGVVLYRRDGPSRID